MLRKRSQGNNPVAKKRQRKIDTFAAAILVRTIMQSYQASYVQQVADVCFIPHIRRLRSKCELMRSTQNRQLAFSKADIAVSIFKL
jgi:hypothetical protein